MSTDLNREGWLTEVAGKVKPLFNRFGMSPYRVTCGWPSAQALGLRRRRLGECHSSASSTGKVYEIFISPLLDDSLEVAGTVCHELAHIAAGIEARHGPLYKAVCHHVGLTQNKPTQAMPGKHLNEKLAKIIDGLGKYPHQAMAPKLKVVERKPKTLRVECVKCSCPATLQLKWLEISGLPTCGCGGLMQSVEGEK